MAFNTKFLLFFVLLVAVPLMSDAFAVWNVGGSAGWSGKRRYIYAGWAKRRTFIVGDSLRFVYDPNTTDVKEVTSSDYNSCESEFALDTFNTGNDTISLTDVGDRYFIASNRVACHHGQRVHVKVSDPSLVVIGPNHDDNGYVNIPKPQSPSAGGPTTAPTMSPTTAPTMSPTTTEAGGEAKAMSPSSITVSPPAPKAPKASSAPKSSSSIRLVGVAALLVPLLGFVY
ncbi:hypothetical protein MKW94_019140 [Papaver nudicaule]|uniref:Phytocyanin domain-containing protein n=1 Tax=Papaver nudicaule TaxID=74823 RepID=A0AA41SLU1_PAPNU|nr:hypothetical protein [Papaver nudicaule]